MPSKKTIYNFKIVYIQFPKKLGTNSGKKGDELDIKINLVYTDYRH